MAIMILYQHRGGSKCGLYQVVSVVYTGDCRKRSFYLNVSVVAT